MKKLVVLFFVLFLISCGGGKENQPVSEEVAETPLDHEASENSDSSIDITLSDSTVTFAVGESINVEALQHQIDLNMDISQLSLSDIRILRNSFAARQGYCFMKADLRSIFNTTSWYNQRMENRFWKEDMGESVEPISYSAEEEEFIKRLKAREEALLKNNLVEIDGRLLANLDNVVNFFQLEETDSRLMEMLRKNGFAIVPNNHIQHFHVYEENDYKEFPNFVTTDMYMQLFHMYFGYVLRTIEQDKFIPLLAEICEMMMAEMQTLLDATPDQATKTMIEQKIAFYAIALNTLTDQTVTVPASQQQAYNTELRQINAAEDAPSDYLGYTNVQFPYSLFKPRGHYTRTDALKKYFKAMMWLQTAPFCLDNDEQFKKAIISAHTLKDNTTIMQKYKALMEPITFIIGQPDNVSFLNLASLLKQSDFQLNDLLTDNAKLESFRTQVKAVADAQNRIKPKEAVSCVDKINFVPQRYLSDNEVLQELVDVESQTTKRPYPKGLDVLAAFGSKSAENVLLNELQEGQQWEAYPSRLAQLKETMSDVDWNATLYNKWIESLLALESVDESYPYFMQTPQWAKKDLNASLASWAELKHDAILYAEQPMASECGGGGPPEPYTLAYVEPNVGYWRKVIELIDKTEAVLNNNSLITGSISRITERMRENAEFLKNASIKELVGEKLTEQEYRQIEHIGSTLEWLTLDLVKQEDEYLDGWHNVQGPDKSVAVVADIYTSNATNNPNKGILHVATGNVNDIYVVVEIEGYLYLTKGAVFSYHEFPLPMGNRLTDEEWQDMLDKNQAPEVPDWVKEIIIPIETPKVNERVFYSSGC
ncbi:MAG: DUF3160 domain-containing protein [Bacteroidota bacterium]